MGALYQQPGPTTPPRTCGGYGGRRRAAGPAQGGGGAPAGFVERPPGGVVRGWAAQGLLAAASARLQTPGRPGLVRRLRELDAPRAALAWRQCRCDELRLLTPS